MYDINVQDLNVFTMETNDIKTKEKKPKTPMSSKKYTILMSIFGVLSCLAGGVGGYFLYNIFKPETKYETGFVDYTSLEKRAASKKNANLDVEFKADPYNLANLAFYNFGNSKYSLTLSNGLVRNISGDQNVKAVTFGDNGDFFNQNISATTGGGPIQINTAYRFYDLNKDDNKDYQMIAYENKLESDWKKDLKPSRTYTYDQYIEDYGKLLKGNYIVDNSDKYISNNLSQYKNGSNNLVSGAFIYQMFDEAVNSSKLERIDNGYKILISLDAQKACSYYIRQIKKNGGMSKNPTFTTDISIEVILDKEYKLVSTHSEEAYNVILGAQVSCNATMDINYYASENPIKLNNNGVDVEMKIPSIEEKFPVYLDRDLTLKFVE